MMPLLRNIGRVLTADRAPAIIVQIDAAGPDGTHRRRFASLPGDTRLEDLVTCARDHVPDGWHLLSVSCWETPPIPGVWDTHGPDPRPNPDTRREGTARGQTA